MPLSKRSQVDPFIVMDVMEAARAAEAEGRRIVHMEVGQPSTAAPLKARQAVAAALPHDAMGYTVALGLPELRAGIAALYKRWYDVDLDPARVWEQQIYTPPRCQDRGAQRDPGGQGSPGSPGNPFPGPPRAPCPGHGVRYESAVPKN